VRPLDRVVDVRLLDRRSRRLSEDNPIGSKARLAECPLCFESD
jgi:hypothetical protein